MSISQAKLIPSRSTWQNRSTRLLSQCSEDLSRQAQGGAVNLRVENTATGQNSLAGNTTGANNTAADQNALKNNTTGSNNIALGSNAGNNLTTGRNNIDIGDRGVAGEANTIRIGTQGTPDPDQ